MSRLRMIDPSIDDGRGADLLNGPLKNQQLNIFKAMASNPCVLEAYLGFSHGVKRAGKLTEREHEIIAMTVSKHNECEYCQAAHTNAALEAGVSDNEAAGIRAGHIDNTREQHLIDFVNTVMETNGFVSNEQLDTVRHAGYDDAAIIEILGEIASTSFTNLFNHVNETPLDIPQPIQSS